MKNIHRPGRNKRRLSRWPVWLVAVALVVGAGMIGPTMADTLTPTFWPDSLKVSETIKTGTVIPGFEQTTVGHGWDAQVLDNNDAYFTFTRVYGDIACNFFVFKVHNYGTVPIKVSGVPKIQYDFPGCTVYVTKNALYSPGLSTNKAFNDSDNPIVIDPGGSATGYIRIESNDTQANNHIDGINLNFVQWNAYSSSGHWWTNINPLEISGDFQVTGFPEPGI